MLANAWWTRGCGNGGVGVPDVLVTGSLLTVCVCVCATGAKEKCNEKACSRTLPSLPSISTITIPPRCLPSFLSPPVAATPLGALKTRLLRGRDVLHSQLGIYLLTSTVSASSIPPFPLPLALTRPSFTPPCQSLPSPCLPSLLSRACPRPAPGLPRGVSFRDVGTTAAHTTASTSHHI